MAAAALVGFGGPRAQAEIALPVTGPPAGTTIFSQASTALLSRSVGGGMPNGPSGAPSVSRDGRLTTLIAFQSDASNIVTGDTNGTTDVFAIHRAEPYSSSGSPWHGGTTVLVSHGLDGQPANGPSYGAAVGGDPAHPPDCVAFVSDASNLVPHDTNGVADAFLWSARSGRITRVSVGSDRRQANGRSYSVSVSGDCSRVAFSSSASNLAPRTARSLAWKSVRTAAPQPGHAQIYVRFFGHGADRPFRGLTMLASASDSRQPGNGDSSQPDLSASGKALAFTSTATNLVPGDGNTQPDVYVRTLQRKFRHFGHGRAAQTIVRGVRLVSATTSGRAGNGASSDPSISDSGRYVAYDTLASDLVAADTNGVADVVRADMSGSAPEQVAISKTPSGLGNGASTKPSISCSGHFVAFQSDASNLKLSTDLLSDPNGVRDMMVGIAGLDAAGVESLNNLNRFVHTPSGNPAMSAHANYIAFESADAAMDTSIANPGLNEVYLRYLGPQS